VEEEDGKYGDGSAAINIANPGNFIHDVISLTSRKLRLLERVEHSRAMLTPTPQTPFSMKTLPLTGVPPKNFPITDLPPMTGLPPRTGATTGTSNVGHWTPPIPKTPLAAKHPWLTHTFAGFFMVSALALVTLLAVQTTKQEGLSGTIGGRVESAYRPRLGFEQQLQRITTIAAVSFVLFALLVSLSGI
jgi:protein translocase SecG subunit